METPFTISFDSQRKIARCELRGFWDRQTIEAYVAAMAKGAETWAREGTKPEEISVITDTRKMGVQSQDLVRRFDELRASRVLTFGREAIVIESALLRMQARRVTENGQCVLTSEDEVEAWLSQGPAT